MFLSLTGFTVKTMCMPNQQKQKLSRQIFSRKTSHCASSGLAPKQIMTLIFSVIIYSTLI